MPTETGPDLQVSGVPLESRGGTTVAALDIDRDLRLAIAAAQTAAAHRGRDMVVLDLRNLTCIFDYFVIVTGTSRRQLHAMSEEIDVKLQRDLHDKRLGREGYDESRWILLDYGSVVVHLFDEETRQYFALESLWGEGRPVDWQAFPPI